MTEHTPTPWSLCGDGDCSCLTLGSPNHPIAKFESGEWGDEYPAMRQVGASQENRYEAYMERIGYGTIDPEVARANARFTHKAVNNHDALVLALKGLFDWYDSDGSVGGASEVFERHRQAFRDAVGGSGDRGSSDLQKPTTD